MLDPALYPPGPREIPANFTQASADYKKQAWLAMAGLMFFMGFYVALMACFGMISYNGIMALKSGHSGLWQIIITVSALLLTVFMAKSLFAVRRSGNPGGVEVNYEAEPKLYEFLYKLADEIGAPRPHRVFITAEVNAAVFYDLSLINLIFPSKKNLIIGLGLVNVLNLGELKAVLAHEFGHFAQGSMMVGRWVYIAQQIISHMVATRDWLDSIVRFVSRIDIRVAWVGWILALILWSIRSLMDTLFNLVIIAERALSREMEFNADLVAVSVTGSDALVNALHKLQAADHAWQTALDIASCEAGNGKLLEDLFHAQKATIKQMRRVLDNKLYGATPDLADATNAAEHRIFTEDMARPPQMWATHPANRDRENNAKAAYISADIDDRESWLIFSDATELRKRISLSFYNADKVKELEVISPWEAVVQRFNKASYSPEYRGTYLNRSPVRSFTCVNDIFESGSLAKSAAESIANLYPATLAEELDAARNLDIERDTLEGLARGVLKPSGGVIRHRGEELKKSEIPDAIKIITEERKTIEESLRAHDASCRRSHLQIAEELGRGWKDYLNNLIHLVHCSEHMKARVEDEQAFFINTWRVITADGQIGYFEKRRMLRACKQVQQVLRIVSERTTEIKLPQSIINELKIENWAEQCPKFDLLDVSKKNWGEWCQAASESMGHFAYALGLVHTQALEELISTEAMLRKHLADNTTPEQAPAPCACPADYPVLLPGDENVLQNKLDLWNRFQLAHGFMPTLARLFVSLAIVGGTIYSGLVFIQ